MPFYFDLIVLPTQKFDFTAGKVTAQVSGTIKPLPVCRVWKKMFQGGFLII